MTVLSLAMCTGCNDKGCSTAVPAKPPGTALVFTARDSETGYFDAWRVKNQAWVEAVWNAIRRDSHSPFSKEDRGRATGPTVNHGIVFLDGKGVPLRSFVIHDDSAIIINGWPYRADATLEVLERLQEARTGVKLSDEETAQLGFTSGPGELNAEY